MRPVRPGASPGSALLWVLVVVGVVSLLAAAVARSNVFGLRSAAFWQERLQAFYAAESGLNLALYRIQIEGESPPAPRAAPCADAPWFQSAPDDFSGPPDTGYRVCVEEAPSGRVLVAQGYSGRSTRTVRLMIRRPRPAAAYFPEELQRSGVIEVGEGDRSHGERERGEWGHDGREHDEWEWPEVGLPDLAPPAGTPPGPELSDDRAVLPPGTYRYWDFEVREDQAVRIEGPATIYVERDVQVKHDAILEVSGAGPVTFYVGRDFEVEKDARFVRTVETGFYVGKDVTWRSDARVEGNGRLLIVLGRELKIQEGVDANSAAGADTMGIYLTTDAGEKKKAEKKGEEEGEKKGKVDVNLGGDVTFVGGLYAPTRTVRLEEDTHLVGAVTGERVRLDDGDATTVWDPDVQDAPAPDAGESRGGAWVADWATWSEE